METRSGSIGYVNNGRSIMIMWENPNGSLPTTYKIYFAGKDGEFSLAGESTFNYFIAASEGVAAFYIELYSLQGKYLAKTQSIKVEVNSREVLDVTAVKSYNGVTLNWSGKRTFSNYYIMRKTETEYKYMFPLEMFQITIDKIPEGDILRVVECDNNGWPIALSEDFVFSSDKFDFSAPENKKISVVIPVYNNEQFLSVCVDSVLSSTMKDLEIIIVDDGSEDNTPAIADWYQENYPGKIRVIHTPNQGAAQARNEGIKAAEGEYIAFADSDDLVGASMYKTLCERAEENGCDISLCDYFILDPKNEENAEGNRFATYLSPGLEDGKVYDADELLSLTYSENYQSSSVCDKVYKTSFVREHLIPARLYEDVAWIPVLSSYAGKFCYTRNLFYCYNRVVTLSKPTISYEMSIMDSSERAKERMSSYEYILEAGNPEKREYLMLVCTRLAIRQLIDMSENMLRREDASIFVDFLTGNKDEINSNAQISADKWLCGRIKQACEKYGFSME